MIITTNLPLKEIESETMLDKRRIYDRILEMCTPMYVGGTSKREAIANMKMEEIVMKIMFLLSAESSCYYRA